MEYTHTHTHTYIYTYIYIYIYWRRKWQSTPVLLPENSMDRRAWWTPVHGVSKSWTQLSNFIYIYGISTYFE